MKFRAVMKDPQYMREFHNITLTLSKLSKECVMSISENKINFIANEEFGSTAPLVWIDIDASLYFPEYTVVGSNKNSRDVQTIMLTISSKHLGRALAMLRNNALYCKFKLTNIDIPTLNIASEVFSQILEKSRQITHDIPVKVIACYDWSAYALPEVPSTKLVLNVPSIRLMRGLIDKLKNISPTITFCATSAGVMSIVAETEMATITARYRNLEVRAINPSACDKTREHMEASCSVDCKKCAIFLSSLHVPTLEMLCGIDDGHLIHMEVNVRQGIVIHSILSAVCV